MAPIRESQYFPSLERCLDGEEHLLSWKTTFTGLSHLDNLSTDRCLEQYLTDPNTITLLIKAYAPHAKPTAQTKSTFETRTSAVNVAPSVNDQYNIKQIQGDALWLSKETSIDEVAALRIAVLEWQERPAAQLLCSESMILETSNITTLQSFKPSSRGFRPSTINTTNSAESDETRRLRLLAIYLSERRYILKTCQYIIFITSCEGVPGTEIQSTVKRDGGNSSRRGWIRTLGNSILEAWNIHGVIRGSDQNFFVHAIDAVQSRVEELERGNSWFQDSLFQGFNDRYANNQVLEIIHIIEMILILLETSEQLIRSDALLAWFRFVSRYGFFENFEPQYPGLQSSYSLPVQSLVALVSLAILKLPATLDTLRQYMIAVTSAADSVESTPYIINPEATSEVNDILIEAAASCCISASPAVLAWSIILQTLREYALTFKEARELQQSQRATERFGILDPQDTDGGEHLRGRSDSPLQQNNSSRSESSHQMSLLEEILDRIMIANVDEDPISYLAKSAVDGSHVFNVMCALVIEYCTPFGLDHGGTAGLKMRLILLDLIRGVVDWIDYQPELVLATLTILTGSERYWDVIERSVEITAVEPATCFLHDENLVRKILRTALSRFPYETMPFLKISRALAVCNEERDVVRPGLLSILRNMESVTNILPIDFRGFEVTREDEEANYVLLLSSLDFVSMDVGLTTYGSNGSSQHGIPTSSKSAASSWTLPEGTIGRVLSESRPHVVMWHYEYSGLAYLGKLLQSALGRNRSNTSTLVVDVSKDVAAEIIGLITMLISPTPGGGLSTGAQSRSYEDASAILEEASDGLDQNQDIISVIFEMFEGELCDYQPGLQEDGSPMGLLIHCIQFVHALLLIMPGRVWPFLGRSSLLAIDNGGSRLRTVLVSAEMASGRYGFLLGCIRVFGTLVNDVVSHAVSRRNVTKVLNRFTETDLSGSGISDPAMKSVLLHFVRTMADILEGTMNWRFVIPEEKLEINAKICSTFGNILRYCFSVDDNPNPSGKLLAPLSLAADYLLDIFLTRSKNDVTIQPIVNILLEGTATPHTTLPTRGFSFWIDQVRAALNLGATFLNISRVRQYPLTRLEERMFESVPIIAKVYAAHESYRLPTIELLHALVRCAAIHDIQPPSLLGYCGQKLARSFLDVLSMLDQPLADDGLAVEIWRMFSAIISCRQQWFAIYLLTGNTPRDSFNNDTPSVATKFRRTEPMLVIAMEHLSHIQNLKQDNAMSMLEFVATAADYWPWTMSSADQKPEFLIAISDHFAQLLNRPSDRSGQQTTPNYAALKMVSVITDILAMYIHYAHQSSNDAFARSLLPGLGQIVRKACIQPMYNASMHGSLRKNFEARFRGLDMASFKTNALTKPELGDCFYYDIHVADTMLDFEPSWRGKAGQGFAAEMVRANINLSLVEAQICFFHSWKFLITELSTVMVAEVSFQNLMARLVNICLKANAENKLPEIIFIRLSQSRADLAFALLQHLVDIGTATSEIKKILPTAWEAIRNHGSNFQTAIAGQDATYYRNLLKILCLALRAHSLPNRDVPPANAEDTINGLSSTTVVVGRQEILHTQVVLEVLKVVVADGFRNLTQMLHDDPAQPISADFTLVIAILQVCLNFPDIERHASQLRLQFTDNQTSRYASTLLSWSDRLAVSTNHDPVYGELSVNFLLELSNVPILAEMLASEGLLAHISTTNLIKYFRRAKGMGPFDSPRRMYNIWSRAILPLFLNILDAVGGPVASEIAAILNDFPDQLSRASNTFDTKPKPKVQEATAGYITLSMASEAQSLASLAMILDTFREAGPSAGVDPDEIPQLKWDRTQVKEDIESWMQRRAALRARIVPVNDKEEELMRQPAKSAVSGATNRLEEKVVNGLRFVLGILASAEP